MNNTRKAHLQIHIAVFLWGLTAILGKLISVSEYTLVWYRLLFIIIIMSFFPKLIASYKTVSFADKKRIFLVGGIVAMHWITFYGAIKYSNVSVALSTMSVVSFLTAIIEPIVNKTKFKILDLSIGVLIIPAILFINQSLQVGYKTGLIIGLISAFLAALFTSLNKYSADRVGAEQITLLQLTGGFVFMTVLLPIYMRLFPQQFHLPHGKDIIYLLILSTVCTILPYILYLKALKSTSAFTTNLVNNLEPVYGIILAAIFFKENQQLNSQFYIGTSVLIVAVLLHALLERRKVHQQ